MFLSSIAFSQAEITIDCPGSWGPGLYNKVTVSILFEKKNGFARFTQDLPVGFEVAKDEARSGDFSWNGSQLNVVWMKIPESQRASFSYFIKPDKQMQGTIDLGGKVVTITKGNIKETSVTEVRQISIGGTGGLSTVALKKEDGSQIVTNVTKSDSKPVDASGSGKSSAIYRVQIASSSKEMSSEAMKKKLGIISADKMTILKNGEIYKYQLGEFSDRNSAVKLQKQLISKGIKDAFIVTVK